MNFKLFKKFFFVLKAYDIQYLQLSQILNDCFHSDKCDAFFCIGITLINNLTFRNKFKNKIEHLWIGHRWRKFNINVEGCIIDWQLSSAKKSLRKAKTQVKAEYFSYLCFILITIVVIIIIAKNLHTIQLMPLSRFH